MLNPLGIGFFFRRILWQDSQDTAILKILLIQSKKSFNKNLWRYGGNLIQIYTGNGKGKTTAAMGLALRVLGHKMNVCIVQFFKNKNYYGEQKIFKKLENLKFYSFAQKHPHFYPDCGIKTNDIIKEVEKAVVLTEKILKEKKYDLLILDELNIVIRDRFVDIDKIVKLLKEAPKEMEIVITGRDAHKKILELADLITEMRLVKHPYRKGAKTRKGIDY
ncbi:MAG: cob(I)yrinic acid a,c-diamide adenosyltransferase [Elusimicrobiota bacterium]